MSIQESSEREKKLWKSVVGFTVTGLAVVGGFLGIYTFLQSYSRYDLTGKWIITNTIQSTSYHPYQGLKLGYNRFPHSARHGHYRDRREGIRKWQGPSGWCSQPRQHHWFHQWKENRRHLH